MHEEVKPQELTAATFFWLWLIAFQRQICLFVLAFLVPPVPLATFFHRGVSKCEFATNVLLTMCGWFPGVIHAWYLMARTYERGY